MYKINSKGREQIRFILKHYHRNGLFLMDNEEIIGAYARSAERDMDKDVSPMVEIQFIHALNCGDTFYLSIDGFDKVELS